MTINHENLRRLISKGKDFTSGIYCHADISALLDELAALRKENEGLKTDGDRWHRALKHLMRGYVSTLEVARDRILFLGGECDQLERMIHGDPYLIAARAAIGDSHE